MHAKKYLKNFFILLFISCSAYFISSNLSKIDETSNNSDDDTIYNSNIINNVEYITKDKDGNEVSIKALIGEIDLANPNIIYLTNVDALIKLRNSEEITITSDFGKYNSENYDTIFSKNVIIKYLLNNISGEYLDFSLKRNSMLISKNVIYKNLDNTLKADVVEININTKDTKIYMYEKKEKVNIKSKN